MFKDLLTTEDCLDLVSIIDALGDVERAIHGPTRTSPANGDAYLRRLMPLRSKLLAEADLDWRA